jgi:hypothetical protein
MYFSNPIDRMVRVNPDTILFKEPIMRHKYRLSTTRFLLAVFLKTPEEGFASSKPDIKRIVAKELVTRGIHPFLMTWDDVQFMNDGVLNSNRPFNFIPSTKV